VLAAVLGEVAIVMIDHREAGAHEAGEREDGDAGSKREGGVGVAEVVEVADRSGFARVSCLAARWTLSAAAARQDVPGQEGDDDHCRRDSEDGDSGGGYDHTAILVSLLTDRTVAARAFLWPSTLSVCGRMSSQRAPEAKGLLALEHVQLETVRRSPQLLAWEALRRPPSPFRIESSRCSAQRRRGICRARRCRG
jgi:hypothetical protein